MIRKLAQVALLALGLTVPCLAEEPPAQLLPEALTSQNVLVNRFFMKCPQLIHVTFTDRPEQFTVTRQASGSLKQVPGLYGEPFLMLHPSAEQLAGVYEIVKDGKVDFQEKLKLAEAYGQFNEKPFQPPAVPEVAAPEAGYLFGFEKSLLRVSSISKKMRWLFNKTMTAPNQAIKLYYGVQIRILTAISGKLSGGLLNDLIEEVTADIDRGVVEVKPGSKLDQFVGVVAVHAMFKDEDVQAFLSIVKGLIQKLQGAAAAAKLEDGPPAGGNPGDHAEATKVRLEAAKKLLELMQNASM